MEVVGYSLWLMPNSDVYDFYQSLIERIAVHCHTSPFSPHITLLGTIDLEEKKVLQITEWIAALHASLNISLEDSGYEDVFFRSFYLKARRSDSLLALRATATMLFEREERQFYMPHMSLLYSDWSQEQKQELVLPELIRTFSVSGISVYRTEGNDARNWEKVYDVPFCH